VLITAIILYYGISFTPLPPPQSSPTKPPLHQDSKPELEDLLLLKCKDGDLDVIPQVASECNTFGIHLGLQRHVVRSDWDVAGRVESKCQNIVDQWLKGKGKKVSWKTVIEALQNMGLNVLAESLSKCIK